MPFLSKKPGWAHWLCPSADLSWRRLGGLGVKACTQAGSSGRHFSRQAGRGGAAGGQQAGGWQNVAERANDWLKFCLCLAANRALGQSDGPDSRGPCWPPISTQRNAATCWGQRPRWRSSTCTGATSGGHKAGAEGHHSTTVGSTHDLGGASPCKCALYF